ncbi:hypothetical protein [Paraliomyxa miuraensis]|uniref:hypothetical protein n=1 Tax=Paraliomyxa miuraensis TaxID=376150 RepID=UPI00224D8710|nr:hypothetical protein [Paraliomyxa miuraensis]MCX4243093.1 hypothetical protein [Paraliomyxa miuraensis]
MSNEAATLALLTLVLAPLACDPVDDLDPIQHDRIGLEGQPTKALPTASLTCDPDLEASVGGLYYPSTWNCAQAIADAESNFGSWHYRNACNQQVGSDIADPVDDAVVTSCQVDPSGQLLVTVDLCCTEPTLACDPDLQAAVGGLYYPGWTCNDAIANAESTLGSWHYRNACNQQVGSDIDDPAAAAVVTDCHVEAGSGQTVVTVDLCCAEPTLACDPDDQATVGGLYYPGWTCNDAIANAESNLGSWHYRNACNQQVGSNIATPAQQAVVTDCHVEAGSGQTVVTVDLCCG